ncbi:lysine histidine transporter-like 8 [Musa acuminata AAA Group]|uniref:lysine histidine transporter-like 8 n=1 Tax=Musa acuminata AAA Group TaxID=214697 RepID=UPI0031CF6E46
MEEAEEVKEMSELLSIPKTPRPPVSGPPSQLHSPSLTRSPMLHSPTPQTPRPSELHSIPATPRPPVSGPPSQLHSPSLTRSPLLHSPTSQTPRASELHSIPATPRPPVSAPPSQLHSPSLTRSPLLHSATPRTPRTPRFARTPLASPMRRAIVNMRAYLEDIGHLTKLDPHDAWLPITESRNGNAYYSAFHTLSSGIGFQALVLPLAFTFLGWTWGILCLSVAFAWQLYTLWLLVQLHESVPGTRYCRYMHLAEATFGAKLGKWLALFPIFYLSAGICTAIIIVGGGAMKLFFEIVCGATCDSKPLTAAEWYLVFTCLAGVLSQLPNLNSIAGVSLIGSVTAVTYCTLIWVISVSKGRLPGVSYHPVEAKSDVDRVLGILNALGIIAFAFRGHNLVLEIQATMPSSLKHPSRVPMWRGVKAAYLIIAFCLYPIAIGGFWAYGNMIPSNGMLTALYAFHGKDTSRILLGLTALLVVVNCLSCFQIYAMPIFDSMEAGYTKKKNRPCPRWLRSAFRAFFAGISYFMAVAFPFLSDLAGLIGGMALPVTLAYPCFMWILVKKPERYSAMWYINWVLGSAGMVLSLILTISGVWNLVKTGIDVRFFKPQ